MATLQPWQTTLNSSMNQPKDPNAVTLPSQYNTGMSGSPIKNTGLVGGNNNLNQTAAVGNVGIQTKSPQSNLAKPDNTTPQPVTTPPTTPAIDPKNPHLGYISRLADMSQGNDANNPIGAARAALRDFNTDYGRQRTDILNNGSYSLDRGTGRLGVLADRYQSVLPSYTQNLATAQNERQQNLSALQSATSGAAPQNQLGFLTNTFNGRPLYGEGNIGGLSGLSYQVGKVNNAGVLAGQQQNQGIAINNARNDVTQLSNLLKTSNLNQNQLAISNWLGNSVAKNLSDPTLSPIQNAVTSAINHYALAQGISPADLTNSLLLQSGSQSIFSTLNNLDTSAYNNYTNTGSFATGGSVSAPVTNLGTATNSTSGVTTGGNKYVITP